MKNGYNFIGKVMLATAFLFALSVADIQEPRMITPDNGMPNVIGVETAWAGCDPSVLLNMRVLGFRICATRARACLLAVANHPLPPLTRCGPCGPGSGISSSPAGGVAPTTAAGGRTAGGTPPSTSGLYCDGKTCVPCDLTGTGKDGLKACGTGPGTVGDGGQGVVTDPVAAESAKQVSTLAQRMLDLINRGSNPSIGEIQQLQDEVNKKLEETKSHLEGAQCGA